MDDRVSARATGLYVFIATVVDAPEITGVERYAIELIRHSQSRIKDIVVLCHPAGAEIFQSMSEKLCVFFSPFHNRVLTDQIWVPWMVRRLRPMAVLNVSLGHPWIGFGSVPFCMMVHDAVPWRYPETISTGSRLYYKPLIQRALKNRHLRLVFTNSRSSRSDIIHYCSVKPEQVNAVHLGVNHTLFHPNYDHFSVNEHVNSDFILSVGTLEPRKNLQTVILAFQKIARDCPDVRLLIVGRKGWLKELEIPNEIERRIVLTGYVSDETLVALYSTAKLFVFPSKYEGFGFPLLEAMCCGAPVLASRISSLPEIGQTACLYADPNSPGEFAEKMRMILANEELRTVLSEQARKQAIKFNWNRTAEETWELLDNEFSIGSGKSPLTKRVAGYNFLSVSLKDIVELIEHQISTGMGSLNLFPINVDVLLQAEHNKVFATTLCQNGALIADGMPIVWLSKLVHASLPERVAGSDLVQSLCLLSSTSGLRLFLLGAGPGIAKTAAEMLHERYGTEVSGYWSPSREEILDENLSARIVKRVNESGANVLLVGFGAPFQEMWIARHTKDLATTVNIAVGGTIDFLAGRVPRAPAWIRHSGLEWFYRLFLEPKRLWRRYLVRDVKFFRVVIGALWSVYIRGTPQTSERGMPK